MSQQALYADWKAYMQAAYPGYIPAAAALENIDAQALSALMADTSQAAVVVPPAIVRAFGTKLYGVQYLQGVPASASLQVTAVDTSGYTLPAGSPVTLNNVGFLTQADLVIPAGSTFGTVTVIASAIGVTSNGAGNPAAIVSIVNWVSSVAAIGVSSGGVDPEDDTAYQNRLVTLLRLLAPRPITAGDFATMALSFAPAAGSTQQKIGRASALDGYAQGAATFTVNLNSNAFVAVTASPGAGVTAAQGATITGAGIPAGTIVVATAPNAIVLSQAATATATGVTATVGGTLGNTRTVTVGVTLSDGTATNAATKTALQTWLASLREVNYVVNVIDPTYTPVYVTVSVHLFPGFDPIATKAAIQQAIINYLSPTNFGLAPYGNTAAWLAGTTIYTSALQAVIQNAGGGAVQYVVDGTLKLGTSPAPTNTLDLVLPGPLALPTSSAVTVPVPVLV